MKTSPDQKLHPHEVATIRSFLVPERRRQFMSRMLEPASRAQVLDKLNHVPVVDLRYARRIPPRDQSAEKIYQLLKAKGAPTACHVMGPSELDGQDVELKVALHEIVPFGQGTLISCIPGRLGYFQGEEPSERYILERERFG